MAKYSVYLNAVASFSFEVEADSEEQAEEIALRDFSPYGDEALADVEFGNVQVGDVEEQIIEVDEALAGEFRLLDHLKAIHGREPGSRPIELHDADHAGRLGYRWEHDITDLFVDIEES